MSVSEASGLTAGSSGFLRCSVNELRTLFLFEKLSEDQLQWLCERGHVELLEPGTVYAEGAPATCFYVLLEGTVVMSRRVGADDIEVGRTSTRGVYTGAFMAYLGDRVPQVYNNSVRVTEPSRFFVLDADGLRRADARLVPDGGAPARGPVLRQQERPGGDRAAGTAARARLAVGRPDPRAEQPGRGRGAGHLGAARAGGRDAAQAGHDRGREVGQDHAGDADQAAGRGGRTGAEGDRPVAAGSLRPGGRHQRLARGPRVLAKAGAGPDLRRGRTGRRLARPRRGRGGPGHAGGARCAG